MCGVFAYFDPLGGPPPFSTEQVLAALARRGPDGQGFVHLPGCSLLHTRLAILDRARGQQPMRHSQTGLVISYNGEIYNAAALRVALETRGHVFRTTTDTEVVLAAFAEYGAASVPMLEGMFAFAIWDPRDRRLHVARDRMGEKPLFFAELPGKRIMVGSELKALLAAGLEVSPDLQALDHYLRWKHVPAERAIYAEVRVVPPATVLSFGGDGVHEARYWRLPPVTHAPLSREQALEELSDRLSTAIRDRLLSDRQIGIFLSGGVDSTLIGRRSPQRPLTVGSPATRHRITAIWTKHRVPKRQPAPSGWNTRPSRCTGLHPRNWHRFAPISISRMPTAPIWPRRC